MTPEERAEFAADIAAALMERQAPSEVLSDDEIRVLKLLIKKQEQSIELRKAIIEKTLIGLVWLVVLGLGTLIFDFAKNHGFK